MNEEQYNYMIKTYGQPFLDSIEEIDPGDVKSFNQRARVNGNQQNNISRYTQQFLNGTEQKIPVSLRGSECMEGTSRAKSKQQAHRADKKQRLKATNYMHEVLGWTDEEWEEFQDNANDHAGNSPATDDDMEAAVERRIQNHRMDTIVKNVTGKILNPRKKPEDLEEYVEAAGRYMKENVFPKSPRTNVWFKNRVRDFLKNDVNKVSSRKTYTPVDNAKFFRDSGHSKWSGHSTATVDKNEHLIVINSKSKFDPNISGALTHQVREYPHIKQTVAISLSNLTGLSDSDIDKIRQDIVTLVKRTVAMFKNPPNVQVVSFHQKASDSHGVTLLWDSKEEQQEEDVKRMISALQGK